MNPRLLQRKLLTIPWANTKITCDGNSLMAGSHATTGINRLPGRVVTLPPSSGRAFSNNVGIGGQTMAQMIADPADVDGSWDATKTNILLVWEGTNGIGGKTAAAVAAETRTYVQGRLALHPWIVILLGTIPRYEFVGSNIHGDMAGYNAALLEYNRLCQAGWRTWGCAAFVDIRQAGGPFDLKTFTEADFTNPPTRAVYSTLDTPGVYTHLSDAGFLYVARRVCSTLRWLFREA